MIAREKGQGWLEGLGGLRAALRAGALPRWKHQTRTIGKLGQPQTTTCVWEVGGNGHCASMALCSTQ